MRYRISQEELMKHNGISDPGKLREGQRLRIPQPPGAAPAGTVAPPSPGTQAGAGGHTTYTVVKGDTLFSLGKKYDISVPKLRDINGFSTNYVIKVGEIIKVPAKPGKLTKTGDPPPGNGTEPPVRQADVRWPIKPGKITYMTGKLSGVTIIGERSESVKSLTQGTVVSAGPYRGFGKGVIVEVDGGYLYLYGGLESLSVKEGDRVGPGMELGKLGMNAVSGKPQLFFTVYRRNVPIDPAKAPRA
jgi:murein DD-endopeptidase MepM/ murein hydrolase activator NlpD